MRWPFRGFTALSLKQKRSLVGKPSPADPFLASIDVVASGMVRGWAAHRDPEIRSIDAAVAFDGKRPIPCDSTLFRKDLLEANVGDGCLSFWVQLPRALEAEADTVNIVAQTSLGERVLVTRSLVGHRDSIGKTIVFLEFSDLLAYVTAHRNISGIQRVQCGFLLHLKEKVHADFEYRLCCRKHGDLKFREVSEPAFTALLADAFDADNISSAQWARRVAKFWATSSSPIACRDGDVLITLGAPWALPDHNLVVASLKRQRDIRYMQVLYDLIPLTAAEYVHETLVEPFAEAVAGLLFYGDYVFAISEYTRRDFVDFCERHAISPPPSSRIEMGGTILDAVGGERADEIDPDFLDVPDEEFVLCVGTIEPRKNHQLLFNIWKKMLHDRPKSSVPKLVLVGRIGWYVESLERHLRFSNYLDGWIIHLSEITDIKLRRLYDRCLFTVFPSFYEGWGLPITESLFRGKLCVASHTTSMKEAGGDHALYIDPLDFMGVYSTITGLLDDRILLADKTDEIRKSYRPASWGSAAADLDLQVARLIQESHRAPGRSPSGGRLKVGTRYSFGHVQALDADSAFSAAMQKVALIASLAGGEWYDPEDAVSWSCSPQPRLCFTIDGESGQDLVCYLSLRLWFLPEEATEMVVEVSVDDGPASVLRFGSSGSCYCKVRLPGMGDTGLRTCDRTLAFRIDPSHPVWGGSVRSENDRRVSGLGLESLYLCRDVADEKLKFLELEVNLPANRRGGSSLSRA